MSDRIVQEKSKEFAIRIVNLYKYLYEEKKEFIMSKQILRSGTSIGANLAEGDFASSKADFINKIHISLKEASETGYWLELLNKTDYITKEQFDSLYKDCDELMCLLVSIVKKAKQ